tara:strand:- start:432 stop:758 length:327 start_codon:yes stop_codon:yes gene_type:complete
MTDTPIVAPPSPQYVPSVDGINLPYSGHAARRRASVVNGSSVIDNELNVTVSLNVDSSVGPNPETVYIIRRLKYGSFVPSAAMHVVGLSFIENYSFAFSSGKRPYRFY